jgi:hypothetical protein
MTTLLDEVKKFDLVDKVREWESLQKGQIVRANVVVGRPSQNVNGTITGRVKSINKKKVVIVTTEQAEFDIAGRRFMLQADEEFKVSRLGTPAFEDMHRLVYPDDLVDQSFGQMNRLDSMARFIAEVADVAAIIKGYLVELSDSLGPLRSSRFNYQSQYRSAHFLAEKTSEAHLATYYKVYPQVRASANFKPAIELAIEHNDEKGYVLSIPGIITFDMANPNVLDEVKKYLA